MDLAATIALRPPAPPPEWQAFWPAFAQAYDECVGRRGAVGEDEFRRELLFCLLGGHGVTYELSLSALELLEGLDVFDGHWSAAGLACALECELTEPQFEPRRKDGSMRRYRFPRRKAKLIAAAREWVLAQDSVTTLLAMIPDERHRREFLCGCPGVGPKSASWLLRNTGYATQLAILDVHVMRAMAEHGRIQDEYVIARDYATIEHAFLSWCDELGAAPDAFDLFLWEWQRGTLRAYPKPA